jgi:hypothetical protein
MKTSICQHCLTQFTVTPGSLGKFCSLSCGTAFRNTAKLAAAKLHYLSSPTLCAKCEISLPYESRKNKFCSRKCSASMQDKSTRRCGPLPKEVLPFSTIRFILCKHTNRYYSNRNPDGTIRVGSPYTKTAKAKYYAAARFKFNVYRYPDEFDLSLIKQHGWYSCPGKKRNGCIKNTNGVSRDHIISVSYGFENQIDPAIIAHPANCRLMLQSSNKLKGSECALTLEQLLVRIEAWNVKYSERHGGLEPPTSNLEG